MSCFRYLLIVVFIVCVSSSAIAADSPRWNVIFLLADDLGWNGLSCYGSDLHQTPNLDALARDGMKFTDAYSACTVCSPTRAAVMTGRYPARLRVTDWIPGQKRPFEKLRIPDWTKQLVHSEVTIAEALAKAGYATAHIGKWHLGGNGFLPEDQGFDENIAGVAAGSPSGGYFLPNRLDLPQAKEGEYLTDHLTERAVNIIHAWKDRPFFIYFPYYTVHTPIQAKPDLTDEYAARVKADGIHTNPKYAAMHHSLDESVGRIVEALQDTDLLDRTIIFFTSDNGGLSHKFLKATGITQNTPLRRGKGSAYEGGVRVPLIVRWPSVTKPGSTSDEAVISTDYFPTILDITDVRIDAKNDAHVDGVSIAPVLNEPNASLQRDAIYWHYPHYHAGGDSPYGAIRAGDWKLIEFYEDSSIELYNLKEDIGESRNLAETERGRAMQLRGQLDAWRSSVDAQMPSRNPNYDPERVGRTVRR